MNIASALAELRSELLVRQREVKALEEAIAALTRLNGASAPPAPAKTKVGCPDCGKRYVPGSGMAAHRKAAHGWKAGMPLDEPVPAAEPTFS